MDVVDFIKEKERRFREQIQAYEIANRWVPQVKQLSERFSESLVSSLPWLVKFSPFLDADETPAVVSTPEVVAFYEKWSERLGQETYVGDWLQVDQARIDQFAQVTGDNQWIHTDVERAKNESPFGSTIAHGFLIVSLIPKLIGAVEPGKTMYPEARIVVNAGLNKVRFPAPVKSGARLRARIRLASLTCHKRSVTLINEIRVEVKGSNRSACLVEAELKIYF